jgi:hypothetical protein
MFWVAYRVGSFPLKEWFDVHGEACERAAALRGCSFYSQVIPAHSTDPNEVRLLDGAVQMKSGNYQAGRAV